MRYKDFRIQQDGNGTLEVTFLATTRTVGGQTYVGRVTVDALKLHRLMIKAGNNAQPSAASGPVGVDLVEKRDPPAKATRPSRPNVITATRRTSPRKNGG